MAVAFSQAQGTGEETTLAQPWGTVALVAANLFVVTGLAPTKGLTLPFISFGGSSMMMALFATGVLLNVSRNEPDRWEAQRENREQRQYARKWERKRSNILRRRKDLAKKYRDIL